MEDMCGDVVVVMALGRGVGFRRDLIPNVVVVGASGTFHVAFVIAHDGRKQRHDGITGVERHTATDGDKSQGGSQISRRGKLFEPKQQRRLVLLVLRVA